VCDGGTRAGRDSDDRDDEQLVGRERLEQRRRLRLVGRIQFRWRLELRNEQRRDSVQ
jgi:hypothetical protein